MKINKALLKGSLVLLITFNLFNFLNFAFQFFMARMLTLSDFGILSALFAIIYILVIFAESIQLAIVKCSPAKRNKKEIKNILKRALKKSSVFATGLFILYVILAIPLSQLLKIDYFLLVLNGLMIFGTFLIPITRGLLQGQKKFNALGVNMIIEATVKLGLALLFVWIGWMVYGAILGTIIGLFVAFALSFLNLKDILKVKEKIVRTDKIYSYLKPSFFVMFVIIIFYSIDILIARIFFPADVAGAYAIAAVLAKVIFLGTQPISRAMFPLSNENNSNKKKSENVFANALFLLFVAIIISLAVFYFFPELIIGLFSGKVIPEAIGILFLLGIGTSVLSLSNLVLIHKLSIGKTKRFPLLLVFVLLEIVLLSYFSENLFQFSIAFIVSSVALLWGSITLIK